MKNWGKSGERGEKEVTDQWFLDDFMVGRYIVMNFIVTNHSLGKTLSLYVKFSRHSHFLSHPGCVSFSSLYIYIYIGVKSVVVYKDYL